MSEQQKQQEQPQELPLQGQKQQFDFNEDKKKLSKIDRYKYEEVFELLAQNIHSYGGGLTFLDLRNGANGESIESNELVSDLGSADDIVSLLSKNDKDYSSKESESFILDVKASNITDISESGYFYKKLASCMDNVRIVEDDCGSIGVEVNSSVLYDEETAEDYFNYKVKDLIITEFDKPYKDIEVLKNDLKMKNLDKFHVRAPIKCKNAKNRCFCKKCCGSMSAGTNSIDSENVGIIATLAITEHVTQSSLSSMNNGREENMNVILERGFKLKKGTYEDFKTIIQSIIDEMGYVGVQARWYEIALLGRIYEKEDEIYTSTTFKNASNYVVDPIGCFLFSPSLDHLKKLVSSKSDDSIIGENDFEIDSCKAKNLFDLF